MMNTTRKLALCCAILPLTANAQAELSPWYIGADAGINNYQPNCDRSTMKECGDDDPFAWGALVGYMLNENIGVELGYRDLGNADWVDFSDKLNDVGVKGMTLGVNSFWPIADRWLFTAEAGAFNYMISNNKQHGDEYYSDRGVAPYVGAGIAYQLTEKLKIAAKYRRYEDLDDDKRDSLDMESNYYGVELSYRFGDAAKPLPVAAKPAPIDSDADGIYDDKDQCAKTPMIHKVDSKGCSIYIAQSERIQIAAKFDNDSAIIKKESYSEIARLASFMNKYPDSTVEISGHASNVGAASYNLTLSQQRAEAVAQQLIERFNIEATRVTAKGYGITMPLIEGSSAEANAANRRIEGLVSGTEKKPVLK